MTAREEPFCAWPGWGHIGFTVLLGLAQALWWVLVFHGADAITEQHSYRVRMHMDWELQVPFFPEAVLGYMSIYPLFWAAPFILRTRRVVAALVATQAGVTMAAGICFLAFPADSLFAPTGEMGVWAGLVDWAKRVALQHNFFPSLHVAMSAVCILIYAARAGPLGKWLLWIWSALISLSTLLLHQHYLVDVAAGYALAWAGVSWGYRPLVGPRWTRSLGVDSNA